MRTFRVVFAVLMLAAAVGAQVSPERLAEQAQAYRDAGQFQGAVLVARDGKPVLSRGFGPAVVEWGIEATPDTKFRLGSITKQFTAMAVLILEEQGKLATGDPIRKLIPEAPEAWAGVTIHHLLTHTSGIPSFTNLPDYKKTNALPAPPAETMKRVTGMPLEFKPGAQFKYSNTGYTLLGLIIERASGQDYASFMEKAVFGPLGMKDTGYHNQLTVLPRFAAGYAQGPKDFARPSTSTCRFRTRRGPVFDDPGPAEMGHGAAGGKLIGAASYKKYFTPEKADYAYGSIARKQDGTEIQMHGGGIEGFATMIIRVPAEKLVVVALGNTQEAQSGKLANDLVLLALGKEVPKPVVRKEIHVPAEVLSRYVGCTNSRHRLR